MTAETLLQRLEGVRCTGANRWIARCPAHDDKSPSLAIREVEDGRMLIHCFAGCSAAEIVGAAGLKLSDLFPAGRIGQAKPVRHPFSASDALRCLSLEVALHVVAAKDLAEGKPLSEGDRKRLLVSAARILEAERLCHGP